MALNESHACRVSRRPVLKVVFYVDPIRLVRGGARHDQNDRGVSIEPVLNIICIAPVIESRARIICYGGDDFTLDSYSKTKGLARIGVEQLNVSVNANLIWPTRRPSGAHFKYNAFD